MRSIVFRKTERTAELIIYGPHGSDLSVILEGLLMCEKIITSGYFMFYDIFPLVLAEAVRKYQPKRMKYLMDGHVLPTKVINTTPHDIGDPGKMNGFNLCVEIFNPVTAHRVVEVFWDYVSPDYAAVIVAHVFP